MKRSLDGLLAKGKKGLKFGKSLPIYLTLGLAAAFAPINAQEINKQEQVDKSYWLGDANQEVLLDTTPPEIVTYTITNPIFSPNGDGIKDTSTIDLKFSEATKVELTIIDSENKLVNNLYSSSSVTNPNPKPWDGTYGDSEIVALDGVYNIRVFLEDPAGNTFTDLDSTITLDTTPPKVSITHPESDSTYTSHVTGLEYLVSDANPDSLWYSTDEGQPRIYHQGDSPITGLKSEQGENTWILYAKDKAENASSDTVRFNVDTTTDLNIAGEPIGPSEYSLNQNYPNPFNPLTTISYSIPEGGHVSLSVYDIKGRKLETLVDETQAPGSYKVNFNASKYPSGIYFCRLNTENGYTDTKKMAVMK